MPKPNPRWNIEDYAYSVLTGRTQQEIAENLPAVALHSAPAATNLAKLKAR